MLDGCHVCLVLEHFYPLKGKPAPISRRLLLPTPLLQVLVASDLLSVSADSLTLHIAYEWSLILCGLLQLSASTQPVWKAPPRRIPCQWFMPFYD